MRLIGFVHRNFGNEAAGAFGRLDVAVNFACFFYRQQKLTSYGPDLLLGNLQSPIDTGDRQRADIFLVLFDEGSHVAFIRRLTDEVGNIEREKVAGFDEYINVV